MLQTDAVAPSTLELLRNLQAEPLLGDARLVGGTALSLQIGHRKSDDLDLFSAVPLNGEDIQYTFIDRYGFIPNVVEANTLVGYIDGVKVDVICHPFPWLETAIEDGGVRLASIRDIAAMKMHAVINSGKRAKDFVDIAFLSTFFSYNEIKSLLLKRYPAYDPIMADRAVVFFDDIDPDMVAEIEMIGFEFDFERIKNRIVKMTDNPDKVYVSPPLKRL